MRKGATAAVPLPADRVAAWRLARQRLDHGEPAHRVSRTAGWISPVVLVGGRVAGVWTSSRVDDRLDVTIELFGRVTAALRRSIETATDMVGAAQGATVRVRYGPVFTTAAAGDER